MKKPLLILILIGFFSLIQSLVVFLYPNFIKNLASTYSTSYEKKKVHFSYTSNDQIVANIDLSLLSVNELGWYTYTKDDVEYLVIGAATEECLNDNSRDTCIPYTKKNKGITYYHLGDTVTLNIDGNRYEAMILSDCEECMQYSGLEGNGMQFSVLIDAEQNPRIPGDWQYLLETVDHEPNKELPVTKEKELPRFNVYTTYTGDLTKGYIYRRFADELVDESTRDLDINENISDILEMASDAYNESDNDYFISSFSGSGTCNYKIGNTSYSNIKVRLLNCGVSHPEGNIKGGNVGDAIPGEELIDFEKYILGVVHAEIGSSSTPDAAIKAQAIAARSYALARVNGMGGKYNISLRQEDGQWILSIRNCIEDQVYCNPDKGCWGVDRVSGSTVYSGKDESNQGEYHREPLKDDRIKQAVNSTNGMIMMKNSNAVLYTPFTSEEQEDWIEWARDEGYDYNQILVKQYGPYNIQENSCTSTNGSAGLGTTKNVVLSPSHQVANMYTGLSLSEKESMFRLSSYVKSTLESRGYNVFVTEENDGTTAYSRNHTQAGVDWLNGATGIYLALHSNAGGSLGPLALYDSSHVESQNLTRLVCQHLTQLYTKQGRRIITSCYTNNGPSRSEVPNFYALGGKGASTLVEVGFHDNKEEAKWIVDHYQDIASSIVDAIDQYIGS